MKKRLLFLLLTAGLTLGAWGSANAIVIADPGDISWGGTCLDCAPGPSPASALLNVLDLGDVGGTATNIGGGNLAGFSYWSSIFPFGLFATGILGATGVIPLASNSMADVSIDFFAEIGYADATVGCVICETIWTFATSSDGTWSLTADLGDGFDEVFDVGVAGVFGPAAAVPEPATVTLIGLALLGLGRRRRAR